MNRFLSHATNRIDAKGRVSVPAPFRAIIAAGGSDELYCFQDVMFPAISAGGRDLLDRLERRIGQLDPFSPQANLMSLAIHGGGVHLRLDAEGRLTVTDFIRSHTGITNEVTFVGRADHFQMWEPKAFAEMLSVARAELRRGAPGSG